jgi:hypothetical protein
MNEFATYLSVFSTHLHVYALVLVILERLKVTMALTCSELNLQAPRMCFYLIGNPLFVSAIVDLTSVANIFLLKAGKIVSELSISTDPCTGHCHEKTTTFPFQFCYCHIRYQSGCEANRIGNASALKTSLVLLW